MKILGMEIEIPDFLGNYITDPFQKLALYALIYLTIGMVQAYIVKVRLRIMKPKNMINMLLLILMFFVIRIQLGIPEVANTFVFLGYIALEMLGHRLFHLDVATIYVIESEKQNVIVEKEVFYMRDANLCVALQDNASTFKRLFLGKHVIVEVNSTTAWTEDYTEQLWLCNSYEVVEQTISEVEGAPETGIRARLHNWLHSNKQVVMRLDVISAHEVSRWDLIQKTAVLDYLVVKYEKIGIAYTKLRTLLTALLIRKQSKVLLSALKTFEDAITITEQERSKITGIDLTLEKEKKQAEEKLQEKTGATVKKETARQKEGAEP